MNWNWLRLIFGGLWLVLGCALLLRDSIGLGGLSERYAAENLKLGGGLALAFAGWNAVRWYSGRRRTATLPTREVRRGPPVPVRPGERPFEYNPELDFLKPEGDAK